MQAMLARIWHLAFKLGIIDLPSFSRAMFSPLNLVCITLRELYVPKTIINDASNDILEVWLSLTKSKHFWLLIL